MASLRKLGAFLTPLLVVMGLAWTTAGLFASDAAKGDSEAVTKLLSDSKAEAGELYRDASEMKAFRTSKLSWSAHAAKIEEIRRHVNNCGKLVQKLNNAKDQGSPWQQQAIEKITPLLSEMASNTTKTIDYLSTNQDRIHVPPYTDYLVQNSQLAKSLSDLVADYVDYGSAKAKVQKLGEKLEARQP